MVECDNLRCILQSLEKSLELSQNGKYKKPIMKEIHNLKKGGKKKRTDNKCER